MKYISYMETKLGKIGIIEEDGQIIEVDINNKNMNKDIIRRDTKLLL